MSAQSLGGIAEFPSARLCRDYLSASHGEGKAGRFRFSFNVNLYARICVGAARFEEAHG